MPTYLSSYFEPRWARAAVELVGWVLDGSTLSLTLEDEGGYALPMAVTLLEDGGLHFRLGEAGYRPYQLLTGEPKRAPSVTMQAGASRAAVTICSPSALLTVSSDGPFLQLQAPDGRIVFQTAPLGPGFLQHSTYRGLGTDPGGRAWLDVQVGPGDAFYGLGEQFGSLNHRGRKITLWAEDAFGLPADEAYIGTPLLLSTAGWGLFLPTAAPSQWDIAHQSPGSMRVVVAEPWLEGYVIVGTLPHLLAQYQSMTGPAHVPPTWSYGIWMSRWGYRNQEELLAVAHRMREEHCPFDVIHLDPYWLTEKNGHTCPWEWDREAFPDPEGMIEQLKTLGIQLSLWVNPFVPKGSTVYDEARARGFLVKTEDGTVARVPRFDDESGMVDFTNPDAQAWFRGLAQNLLDMGVGVLKTDFGETAPFEGARYDSGIAPKAAHNLQGLLYQETAYEASRAVRGDEAMVWGRSGYAGFQRYPLQWGGDSGVTYEYMATSLRGALSYALSGALFTAFDAAGFEGTPKPEVYQRWTAMGTLFSHTRFHGTTPREPWEFGEEAMSTYRLFADLRYRLLPYLWQEAEASRVHSRPLVSPLVLINPEDRNTYSIDDQYWLGRDLLVVPLFNDDGRRSYYLPEGQWYAWNTGSQTAQKEGLSWHTSDAIPLDQTLLWVRAGAVIPLFPTDLQHVPEPDQRPTLYRLFTPGCNQEKRVCYDLTAEYRDGQWIVSAAHSLSVEIVGGLILNLEAGERATVKG